MIATLLVIALAFYWMLRETDYLRVNLCGESLAEYDKRILGEMEREWLEKQAEKEKQYQEWLKQRYEPKYIHTCLDKCQPQSNDYPQYKWKRVEEDREKRRNGEMIYQRGRHV